MRNTIMLAGLITLAGCASPGGITATPASAAEREPVLVVADLTPSPDGLRYNEHGGIIPDAAPTTPVAEGGISEVPTD